MASAGTYIKPSLVGVGALDDPSSEHSKPLPYFVCIKNSSARAVFSFIGDCYPLDDLPPTVYHNTKTNVLQHCFYFVNYL